MNDRDALEHPGFLPASLLAPADERAARRTPRDWFVDVTFFLVAVLGGLAIYAGSLSQATSTVTMVAEVADLVGGAACCVALWWRRQHPVAVGVLAVVVSAFSASCSLAVLMIIFTVTVHRRLRVALAVAVTSGASSLLFAALRPQQDNLLTVIIVTIAVSAAVIAWGLFVRARRQLVLSLRAQVSRAEDEQRLQAEQARLAERTRIAREMHDVLAHRISLIALHAGGLEVNPDLTPEQVQDSARLLRSTARQALEELRDVIGVLRSDPSEPALVAPPQPTLADVPRLIRDGQAAGLKVSLTMDVPADAPVPDTLGRTAYRILQEALTNVGKHARGTMTTVQISGAPGVGLAVVVRNRLPVGAMTSPLPGAGAGLLGLSERVALSGGALRHGPDASGDFVVDARLRWEQQ